MTHRFLRVNSKEALIECLKYISVNADLMSDGILIHLEIHGSNEKNGLVLNDNSLITWFELVNLFRNINIASRNHLYVSMASCYGRYLHEGVKSELKSPYSGYISASKEVLPNEIIEDFSEIYTSLIEQGNLIEAYTRTSNNDTKFFYKDSKTTFEDLMVYTMNQITNDPTYKEEILKGKIFAEYFSKGDGTEKVLDLLLRKAFFDIYSRHKQAFDFE